jgi:Flp pilus assembly protein TadG
MVEMALVLPMVLLILFGIVETGRFIAIWAGTNTAAREGARYGQAVGPGTSGIRYTDCTGIRTSAKQLSGIARLTDADIEVVFIDPATSTTLADCDAADLTYPSPNTSLINQDDQIQVTATAIFQTNIPLISTFLGTITVSSTDTRSIFEGA